MKRSVELETMLNDLDPAIRAESLAELAALVRVGAIEPDPERDVVNMHCHTFFSFNAYGHSPASLAWLGKKRGYKLMGIVDFDVLDGVDEFLAACEAVDMRGTAGIETRVLVPEYAEDEINSPGEPGICYHMGIGFVKGGVPDAVAPILADLGRRADQRNQRILARINDYLDPVTIEYERDVLPLTPAGHPTERHMVVAYVQAARRVTTDPVAFWANRLGLALDEMATVMADSPRFQTLIRAKLMKRGGVGYVQPESGMFPSLEAFHKLVVGCGALPCAAWLDGTSAVEQDPEAWLEFMVGKGVVALNIIPDRNWNIADTSLKRLKLRNLYRIVDVAREMDLPLNVGTEMNSFGQKLLDSFDAPELAPVRRAFVDGAHFVYGHTVVQRVMDLGYQSKWAQSYLPTRRQRNEFYRQCGHQIPPGPAGIKLLQRLAPYPLPDKVLAHVGFGRHEPPEARIEGDNSPCPTN
jgi:hypothetical protein